MHDQNFKNLILDYPVQALEFFAGEEAGVDLSEARIVPVRQEQLMERLGDRFRELDTPLLVEWSDGRREGTEVRGQRTEVGGRRRDENQRVFNIPFGALLSGFGGIDGNGSCGSGCHFLEGGR